jgi:hypothetical protein
MTKLKTLHTPAALLAAFTLAAAPSFAQEKYHGRQNSSGQQQSGQASGGHSRERAQPRSEAPRAQAQTAQPQAARPQNAAPPPVAPRQQAPRVQPQRQAETPRGDNRANNNNRAYDYRGNNNAHNDVGRAVPRGNVYAPHYDSRYSPHYSPHVYAPRVYGPRSYYRPYVFRPRYSVGFGIYLGYPVPYTYSYPYPIAVYGYGAPRSEVMVAPGSTSYGGVALEITPADADVYVDGQYAGRVQDFDGTTQPLTLTPGTHRIEVQAQGYEPLSVDVGIQPGQVIPYRGDLRPYER